MDSNQGVAVVKKITVDDNDTNGWDEFIEEMKNSRQERDRQHGLVEPNPSTPENDTV